MVIGQASVLFTFYPPLTASPWFYIGLVLVVVGSWSGAFSCSSRCGNGKAKIRQPVPLAMFATVANAVMWLWTTVGVAAELLFQVIPASLGIVQTIDAALRARCSPGRSMPSSISGSSRPISRFTR